MTKWLNKSGSMYSTDALQTFIGAVEGVRADQRAADENRMRMMALESQLATEQAERDLLPARLELESKKLDYDISMGNVDMLMKVAGTVDQLQTNQLGRDVTEFELGERKWASPYDRALKQIQYQAAVLDAWYLPSFNAAKLTQLLQMNITGVLHGMAAWATSNAPLLAHHANAIMNAENVVKGLTTSFVGDLVDRSEDGQVIGWKGKNKWIGVLQGGATGAVTSTNPEDGMAMWARKLAQDWGDSFKVVTDEKTGAVSYMLPDQVEAQKTLAGAHENMVVSSFLKQAVEMHGASSFSQEAMRAKGAYLNAKKDLDDAIAIAATPTIGSDGKPVTNAAPDQEKIKEINKMLGRYLYDNSEFGQKTLRDYLKKVGGNNLVNLAMGSGAWYDGQVNLKMAGFNLVSYGEGDKESVKFTMAAGTPQLGAEMAAHTARQIIPDLHMNRDVFSAILDAEVTRQNTTSAVRGLEQGLIKGLSFGNAVFENAAAAMGAGLFGGIYNGHGPPGGGTWTPGSMVSTMGTGVNGVLTNWEEGLLAAGATASGGYRPWDQNSPTEMWVPSFQQPQGSATVGSQPGDAARRGP